MLTPKQQKFINKWEKQRVNKRKFCFIYGSLGWGISTALVTTILLKLSDKETNYQTLESFILQVIFLMIGGYFFGLFLYNSKENGYQNLLKSDKEEEIEDPIIGDEWKTQTK